MFSEWRKRSKLLEKITLRLEWLGVSHYAYDLARAAYKAGVRAGIKQEQARKKK